MLPIPSVFIQGRLQPFSLPPLSAFGLVRLYLFLTAASISRLAPPFLVQLSIFGLLPPN